MDTLGTANRCLIVAEVAQGHDGSLGMAYAFTDAVARAGADAVKFQTHIAAAESTPAEPWRVKFSLQDESRYGYWKRMEFTENQWRGLREHASRRGLQFLSSPFSVEAARMLHRLGVPAWKIASGEVGNPLLLDFVLETGLPVLLSTGMSPLAEIDAAVASIQNAGARLVVLQCTSAYPCPPEKVGFNLLPFYRQRYRCEVGLSDHSGCIYPGLAAAVLGASVVEVHVTFSREAFGPDVPASVTTAELAQLVEGIRFIERMRAATVDKDRMAAELEPMRRLFTKSVVAQFDLPAGTVLTRECLALKKPGTGLTADRLPGILGRVLRRAVTANEFLSEADLGEQAASAAAD